MTAEPVDDVTLRMPRGRGWTWADLQDIPDDGHRYEIIDGSLYVSASPTPAHQIAADRLRDQLLAAAPDHLEVITAVDVDLGRYVLEPDLVVVPAVAAYAGAGSFKPTDVLLAVEVVSPSSHQMDRLVKPAVFAEAGIPAYWRVELEGPGTPSVVVHELVGRVYRQVVTIAADQAITVDQPFVVEVRPGELVGPRRRG